MGISFEGLVGSRKADGVHRSVTASWASEGRDNEMGSDRTSVCSRASRRPPKHVGRCSDAGLWECHHSRAWPASLLLKQIVYSISYAAVVTQAYLLALLYTRAISDKKLVGTQVLFDCFQMKLILDASCKYAWPRFASIQMWINEATCLLACSILCTHTSYEAILVPWMHVSWSTILC